MWSYMLYTVKRKGNTRLLRRAVTYKGLYSAVARNLGVSRQYVWQVATQRRTSEKVEAAILREVSRRDRESAA
jgi:hypothetical protein